MIAGAIGSDRIGSDQVDSHPVEDRANAILFEAGLLEIDVQVFDLLPGGFQCIVEQGPGQFGLLEAGLELGKSLLVLG